MAEQVLASTMIAPKTFEVREYPLPDIPPTPVCCEWKLLASAAVTYTSRLACEALPTFSATRSLAASPGWAVTRRGSGRSRKGTG